MKIDTAVTKILKKEANDSGVPALIEIMGKVEPEISIIPIE